MKPLLLLAVSFAAQAATITTLQTNNVYSCESGDGPLRHELWAAYRTGAGVENCVRTLEVHFLAEGPERLGFLDFVYLGLSSGVPFAPTFGITLSKGSTVLFSEQSFGDEFAILRSIPVNIDSIPIRLYMVATAYLTDQGGGSITRVAANLELREADNLTSVQLNEVAVNVPEPTTIAMAAVGLVALSIMSFQRRARCRIT